MATWQDGPEYAPAERPTAFVDPPAEPLQAPPAATTPAVWAPADQPVFSPPTAPTPALAALVPSVAAPRNPQQPFEVTSSTITNQSAWSAVHSQAITAATVQPWTPEQPVAASAPVPGYHPARPAMHPQAQVNPTPFPTPGTPQWFGPPPPWARVPEAPPAVSIGQMITGATPGVLVPLAVGAVFSWLSVVMLAISFALSARIAYRRETVRRIYSGVALGLAIVAATNMLDDTVSPEMLWETVSNWAQLACWVIPVLVVLVVGAALRAGERPERTL